MDAGTGTKVTHILLLEDETAHQDLVLRAFRNDPEKFRVSVAGTVRDALEIIGRENPDLIISDWILPDGKGIEVLPRTDGVVTIPLIIMTSFGDEHLAVEIMKSGAIDYVVKSATVFHEMPHIARRALRDWNNIQERKRAEKEKQDSEKRLADIISFLPDAVLAIDNNGRVIAWNEAIEQMTGVASEEMLGKDNYEYSIPFYGERRPILIDLILSKDEEIEKKYLTSMGR
jgi:DNA-binding response OmpR family regulator